MVERTSVYAYVWLSDDGVIDLFFFFQAEDGIRDYKVTGVQTCALPIYKKFLGVLVDDDLMFKQHVASITGKASSKQGFLKGNVQLSSLDIKALIRLTNVGICMDCIGLSG